MSNEPGVISPAELLPYPKFAGINNLNLSPTTINCKPSVQPFITWFKPKLMGAPRSTAKIYRFIHQFEHVL